MKIELRCVDCGETYLVDRSTLPPNGGEMPCLGCGSTIRVDPDELVSRPGDVPDVDTPNASEVEGQVQDPSAEDPGEPAAPPAPGVATAATTGGGTRAGEEVVCPRCKLHFVPRRSHAEAVAAARGGDRPIVLVVEDMDYFQEIARESLGSRFDVRTAGNAEEARAEIARGGVRLMIIDLELEGGESGPAFLAGLRPKKFPILVFTAQDESEIYGERWEELRAMGADDLVLKGMNVGEVLLRKSADLLGIELAEEDVPE